MIQIMKPLWAAYQCLKLGRDRRQPLNINSTEHRIVFAENGQVAGVTKRVTLEANKLIEEMMIDEKDLNYFFLADSADEAVGHINTFYSKYLLKPNF